jgi:phosphoglycolate phosphatase-like HAD superfamily hydrolase
VTAAPVTGLGQIAARCHHLLLDFDGPICAVFATTPSQVVADELRTALRAAEVPIPEHVTGMDDPLEVFQMVARWHPDAAPVAQRELTRLELLAIPGARPTEGAGDLIATATNTGRTVTIVTNNSGIAVRAYLDAHGLSRYLTGVIGRDDADPERMKPSPLPGPRSSRRTGRGGGAVRLRRGHPGRRTRRAPGRRARHRLCEQARQGPGPGAGGRASCDQPAQRDQHSTTRNTTTL